MLWFLFSSLIVVGSLVYNTAVKIGGDHINGFLFATVLASVALVLHASILIGYKTFFAGPKGLVYDATGLWMGCMAGLGVVIVDLAFFFALRHGSIISTQIVWVIGGTLAFAAVAILFFGETLTMGKSAGILLGMAGLYLVLKA